MWKNFLIDSEQKETVYIDGKDSKIKRTIVVSKM